MASPGCRRGIGRRHRLLRHAPQDEPVESGGYGIVPGVGLRDRGPSRYIQPFQPRPVGRRPDLIGLTYAAKQENLAKVKNVWPLAFLALPFAYAATSALASPIIALIYIGFLLWVIYALVHLMWRSRINFPLAVGSLLARISFLDALLISGHGEVLIGLLAVGAVVLTRLAQRYIPGT